jgi:hypothetical protein
MGQSYRIRTELGVNKTINVQLDQEFEFLEILSLKIQQQDIYPRSCSDYGVVVGRITANNGFGVPNARVSVFIPIDTVDESNPIISSIYPYKSPSDKNSDGYRYNLLPYEKSFSKHAATGTFPSRNDALTNNTAIEIYDKYYKYTAKTNESGDYMIMGVPLGPNTMVMDVDLSDIGEFSLTPQDLIRTGLATEAQVAGNQFRTSTDLNSLPQLVTITKTIDVSPLWGDPELCQLAVNRLDFDLRGEANVNIEPTAVFMGSMFSTPDNYRVRNNCRPRDNMGNLCNLVAGPGQILAIRQTINLDANGNPVLEVYNLEQAGNVIDGDGTWIVEMPMNLDYLVTNEFGEKVYSNDPTIGIPTKAKYRFKIKWQQPGTLTQETRRAFFLVPNIREYGWETSQDPNTFDINSTIGKELLGSYYFGLDWTGYTNSEAAINCEDSFYEFSFNRVYTVSGLIDEYKNGYARGRFIGIKEIDSPDCSSTVNKFPVNDGVRNFDLLFFIFSLIFQIIQIIGIPLLVIFHFLAYLWNNFASSVVVALIALFAYLSVEEFIAAATSFPALGLIFSFVVKGILYLGIDILLITQFGKIIKYKFGRFKIPMITYPDCQACDCESETTTPDNGANATSLVTQFSNSGLYYTKLAEQLKNRTGFSDDDRTVAAVPISQSIGTYTNYTTSNYEEYKSMESPSSYRLPDTTNFLGTPKRMFAHSNQLPLGERINVFNTRKKYFDGVNRMNVTFDVRSNIGKFHTDNTLTTITNTFFPSGTLLTFVRPESTKDVNYLYTASTVNFGLVTGISGRTLLEKQGNITVNYATTQLTNSSVDYFLSTGSTEVNYKFPLDIEYYQVITALTISQAAKLWSTSNDSQLPGILMSNIEIFYCIKDAFAWGHTVGLPGFKFSELFDDFNNQYITIIQRGVDPYSPKYTNQYGIGKILGLANENDLIITANTRLNIPIQKLTTNTLSVQPFDSQSSIFYPSYFFEPGDQYSSFTTSNVGYYSALDANYVTKSIYANRFTRPMPYLNGVRSVTSSNSNNAYSSNPSAGFYDASEDVSGAAYYSNGWGQTPDGASSFYLSPSLYPTFSANPMPITSKLNVLRTDRLPSSDYLNSLSWNFGNTLLQQNLGFTIYQINTENEDFTSDRFGSGAQQVQPDLEDQIAFSNVIETVSTCESMVGLKCYSGNSVNFGIKENCPQTDTIQNGCYVFMEKPLTDLNKDLASFAEWGYRFRFFYGLCRGVLSETFVNNWVNGTLYAYPIQVDTYYDKQNKPTQMEYCRDLVYFDSKTNNFYYRSSPYNGETNSFVGKTSFGLRSPVNVKNLQYPTTIINLGMKDSVYSEITFDPTTNMYVMNQLNDTSYSDTSDLLNLFVITRITDENFIQQVIPTGNNSLNQLFSRPELRIDGDLAQLLSINSEEGVTPFSPQFYASHGSITDPVVVLSPAGDLRYPTMGVFFSSTTEDLQFKDYLTPGRIDFRPVNNAKALGYNYGIKSQVVPFYQWGLHNNSNSIFGTELNNWVTNYNTDSTQSGIFKAAYQSLDRTGHTSPSYFIGSNTSINDTYARGYIFNVDDFGVYSINGGTYPKRFHVGAPFHFYFGLIKGSTALDKFKTKYSVSE